MFKIEKHCSGPDQSPISIHTRRSIPSNFPALEFIFYHNLLPSPLKIHNNGHSVSLIVHKPHNFTQFPYIFGGKLKGDYEFVGLHFHWGDKNNRGAVNNHNNFEFSNYYNNILLFRIYSGACDK
jgi:carbonic anhydrase